MEPPDAEPRTDPEAALVADPADPSFGIPPALHALEAEAWAGRPSQRIRLLHAIDAYARLALPIRSKLSSGATCKPDPEATRHSLSDGSVCLIDAEGQSQLVGVPDFLDANPIFARVAGFQRRWQREPQARWTPWDALIAWIERAEPATFELPPPLAPPGEGFGWTLDLGYGCRASLAGDVVRLNAPGGSRRRLIPVAELSRALTRHDQPVERLSAAPLRVQGGLKGLAHARFGQLRWAQDEAVLERTDEAGQVVHLTQSLHALREANPAADPLLSLATAEAVREISRRLAAHDAAGGTWQLPESYRTAPGCAHLPLSRWRLDPDGLPFLAERLVRLHHELSPVPVTLPVRDALDGMRLTTDPTAALLDDPTRDPDGGLAWILRAEPLGFQLAPVPAAVEQARCVPHGQWIRANPTLLPLLHRWLPDLGTWSEDPGLRDAIATALRHVEQPALRDALAVPLPRLDHAFGQAVAEDLLHRDDRDVPVRFRGRFGRWWRWTTITPEGRLRFVLDTGLARFPALTDRAQAGVGLCALTPGETLSLSASQLTFAHPALARAIVAWQRDQGAISDGSAPPDRADRVSRLVHQASEVLAARVRRARGHLRLADQLGEEHAKVAHIQRRIAHMEANLDALRRGKALGLRLEQAAFSKVGAGIAVGNEAHGQQRYGDDRLRIEDGILSPALGRTRVFLVAGGEPDHAENTGPLIDAMLTEMIDKLGWAIHLAADLEDARRRGTEAIAAAGVGGDHAMPYANLVAAVEHVASGTWLLWWCGSAGAWRFDRVSGRLTRLTFPHSLAGLAQQAWACGLDPAAAVAMPLQLLLRRTTRLDLEDLGEDELISFANKMADVERWTASRAGLGGAREAMREEHARLVSLLDALDHAGGSGLRLDPITQGAELIFSRVYAPHEAERLVLATDGFSQLCEVSLPYVQRALHRPDPQRAATWLCEPPAQEDVASDDIAIAIIDTRPVSAWEPTHSRRKGEVYKRTFDQSQLLEGGVVPPIPDSDLPALRFVPGRLGKYFGEVSDMLRDSRIPSAERDPAGFTLGVARYVQRRVPQRDATRREGEPVRDLHEVFDEPNDDPFDDTLITLFLLRRRGIDATYEAGLRGVTLSGELVVSDTCWLRVTLGGVASILDLGLPRPVLIDAREATRRRGTYAPSAIERAIGRVGTIEYWPDTLAQVEVPDPNPLLDPDPWERLAILRPTPIDAKETRVQRSSPSKRTHKAAPQQSDAPTAAPTAPVAEPPKSTGWLSLDDL